VRILIMGVAGVGKSTVGRALAETFGVSFFDADVLHSDANQAKMAAGVPLTDDDRAPWLDEVGKVFEGSTDIVVACSALKRAYRDRLRKWAPGIYAVHLTGNEALLARRVSERQGHFMGAALLPSQLQILQPLGADEPGVEIDVREELQQIVSAVRQVLCTA
jgi:carbohydrate kinase (thermoresistant glucokinase family)